MNKKQIIISSSFKDLVSDTVNGLFEVKIREYLGKPVKVNCETFLCEDLFLRKPLVAYHSSDFSTIFTYYTFSAEYDPVTVLIRGITAGMFNTISKNNETDIIRVSFHNREVGTTWYFNEALRDFGFPAALTVTAATLFTYDIHCPSGGERLEGINQTDKTLKMRLSFSLDIANTKSAISTIDSTMREDNYVLVTAKADNKNSRFSNVNAGEYYPTVYPSTYSLDGEIYSSFKMGIWSSLHRNYITSDDLPHDSEDVVSTRPYDSVLIILSVWEYDE